MLSKSALPLPRAARARAALCPNAFSVREPLDGVEELGAEGGIGPRARHAPRPVQRCQSGGRDERDERGHQVDERDRQVDERHEGEDEDGRERGDEELRQVLAEVHLELLDALDHRQDHVARARPREVRGAERGDVVVERLPEPRLHARRRPMGDHGPVVLEHAAQQDRGGGERGRHHERRERVARDDARQQPAEEDETADAHAHRDEADQHRPRDAQAHAAGEGPEPGIEIHGRSPLSDGHTGVLPRPRLLYRVSAMRVGARIPRRFTDLTPDGAGIAGVDASRATQAGPSPWRPP